MLTLDSLREYGADVDEGLARCVNSEALYLKLAAKVPGDANFDKLKSAVEAGDLDAGFEAAHTIKGVAANLSLTPILDPVAEITELLRTRSDAEYAPIVARILDARDRLEALIG